MPCRGRDHTMTPVVLTDDRSAARPDRHPLMRPMIHSSPGTFTNQLKTIALLASVAGLLMAVGLVVGGRGGLIIAIEARVRRLRSVRTR